MTPTVRSPSRGRPAVGGYVTMALAVAVMVLPLVWMALASFKGMDEIYQLPIQWLPESAGPDQLRDGHADASRSACSSSTARSPTVLGAGLKMLLGLMTAYALVFIDIPFRRFFFWVVVCALLVPQQIVLIPNYALVAQLGWLNTYQGMIVPGLASAFGTFLFRQHFLTLPRSILEAAELDGAGHWRRLWRFVVPLSGPTIAAVGLVSIVYRVERLPLAAPGDRPAGDDDAPVGLTLLMNFDGVPDWGVIMAGTVLVTVPVLAVFFLLQRRIVAGLVAGAVTG